MKIATAIGPEMNKLMEKKLSMETLEMISGGEGQDEMSWGETMLMPHFPVFVLVTKVVLCNYDLKSSDELYWWIRENSVWYSSKLTFLSPPAGIAFGIVPWKDIRKFTNRIWKALH